MENQYDYKDIIQKLNAFEIIKLCFYVDGYAHYRNCTFKKVEEPILCIQIELTNDNFEKIRFRKFIEDFKLFNFGRKGNFTLKQIWDKVRITEIVYAK